MQKTPFEILTGLRVIRGAELPPQAWSSRYGTRLRRDVFTAPTVAQFPRTQPTGGGLFTSSLIYVGKELLGTTWTEQNPVHDGGSVLYQVIPKANARIVVIDSRADLEAAIARWPDVDEYAWSFRDPDRTVDWPAAAREVDGFWLTVDGNDELHFGSPNLYTWDTEQVLWLRPAFLCGRRLYAAPLDRRPQLRCDRDASRTAGAREAFLGALRDPVEGPAAREWAANLNPVAAGALGRLVGLDLSPDALAATLGLPSLL